MTAVMDVAYLDAPHIAHLPRRQLRVCRPCWEETCIACWENGCICACQDYVAPRAPHRCPECRYLDDTIGHLVTCQPAELDSRLQRLADSIGARR
jgi:hypothetical protein